jgi:hypothetical protein
LTLHSDHLQSPPLRSCEGFDIHKGHFDFNAIKVTLNESR